MIRAGALTALVAGLSVLAAGPAAARCEDHVPQPKPQNASRDIVGQDLDQIMDRGWIEFAVYEAFPPWSYEKAGKAVGVDIDIARLIAEDLGVEARFRLVGAGENLEADLRNYVWKGPLIGGRVANVMMHVPYDGEFACRVEQVVFTGQAYAEAIVIAYDAAFYEDSQPVPAFFRFDEVGVENDTIADFYLGSLAGGALRAKMRRYPAYADAMAALNAGDVRAVVGPRGELEAGAGPRVKIHQPPLPGLAQSSWTLGVAVRHTYRALSYAVDGAIEAALADGRIAAIFADHGLTFQAPER